MFEEEDDNDDEQEVDPQFSDDERVQFMGEKISQMLKVKTESWNKFIIMEENQILLTDYFEGRVKFLVFTSAASAVLTASSEVSVACAAKVTVYYEKACTFTCKKKILWIYCIKKL